MDTNVYSMMQTEKPYKSYIKRILGKVYITVLNPFNGEPEGILLSGNPKTPDDSCIVDVWNEKEDMFFKRSNKRHFETGTIVEYQRKEREPTAEELLNQMSEEDMKQLLSERFFKFQNTINQISEISPLFTILAIANDLDKSEKITSVIESRIAELQAKEYAPQETK